MAFDLIRTCYPTEKFMDRLVAYVCSSFPAKTILIPEKHTYRMIKGMPSGNPFGSIIGTLFNHIMIS